MGEVLHGLLSFLRENHKSYYEKEVVVVSHGCEPHHLRLVSHRKYDRATLGRELNRTRPHFLFFFYAKITSRIMKEGYIMTWKQIEASREARLWIGQVIVPAVVGIMAVSPEARQTVKSKYVQVKNAIRRKLEKRG